MCGLQELRLMNLLVLGGNIFFQLQFSAQTFQVIMQLPNWPIKYGKQSETKHNFRQQTNTLFGQFEDTDYHTTTLRWAH